MLIGMETQKIEKVLQEDFFFLETTLYLSFNRKQNCISLSTIEVEYIAAGSGCR